VNPRALTVEAGDAGDDQVSTVDQGLVRTQEAVAECACMTMPDCKFCLGYGDTDERAEFTGELLGD
jgi:hypothetical protein